MRKTLAALGFAVLAAAQAPVTSPARRPEFSFPIKTRQENVKVGSAVTIEVTMKNTSAEDMWYGRDDFGENLDVTDEKGAPAKSTEDGAVRKGRMICKMMPDATSICKIDSGTGRLLMMKPGESVTHTVVVSRLFEFPQSGTYSIQATRLESGLKTVIRSNVIKVVVQL